MIITIHFFVLLTYTLMILMVCMGKIKLFSLNQWVGEANHDMILYTVYEGWFYLFSPNKFHPIEGNSGFSVFLESGGRGRIRTDERTKRADLQSASFSHLDTLPKQKLRNLQKHQFEASRLWCEKFNFGACL